jgi:hypothetical protein
MQLEVIGEHPFAQDKQGRQLTRIGTLFPQFGALYTGAPGVHAGQRVAFIDHLNAKRAAQGMAPLSPDEEESVSSHSVDLVFDPDLILIRPDPAAMDLACEADELLQSLVSKRRIKFLSVSDSRVREVLKRRGEYWRLSSLPKTREAKKRLVFGSKVAVNGRPIYYYSRMTGTRWLTLQEFEGLRQLDDTDLARHLQEIAELSARRNRVGHPEVGFFAADFQGFGPGAFDGQRFEQLPHEELRARFEGIVGKFRGAVHEACRKDDFQNRTWCERILSTLFLEGNESESEQIPSGLSREFFMQIEWLPGGRFEEGEFLVDPLFEEAAAHPEDEQMQRLCDGRAKEIILDLIRDYGDVEYLNLGLLPESLSLERPETEGRRAVYLVEFQARGDPAPMQRILRLQKWGVWEHLDEGKGLMQAMLQADEYTDYLLDRRLGCRQLGMNLCRRVTLRRLNEVYQGANANFRGQPIRTTCLEREYLPGIATDKLPVERYSRPDYAVRLAEFLGAAAAPGLIVGRSLKRDRPAFDDGDEVVQEGPDGLPSAILVADHSGAFSEFKAPLESFAEAYAWPVNKRLAVLPQPREFALRYLAALRARFVHIQEDYRKRRRAFDNLFKHRPYDPGGSFRYRWECVLRRLDQTDVDGLIDAIRRNIHIAPGLEVEGPGAAAREPKAETCQR